MLAEKRILTDAELDSQAALELPDRELMLITVVIVDLIRDVEININVTDLNVGAAICAAVLSNPTGRFDCDVVQS